ncbi:hypothetical protein U91I_01358 [alpha proteobacterium U9-1i]|nr:hypothetical protein U91I_01358 [alpha proteobacterium U9-1i]
MKVVYTTRLRLRSRLMIPRFFFANIPITLQLIRAPGFLGGASIMEGHASPADRAIRCPAGTKRTRA